MFPAIPDLPANLLLDQGERLTWIAVGAGFVLLVGALFSRRRRGVFALLGLVLRAAAIAIVGFLLLEPFVPSEERRPGTLLGAVDVSRSVAPEARAAAWTELRRGADQPDAAHLLVRGFAGSSKLLDPGRPLPDGAAFDDLVSDPLPALAPLLLTEAAGGDAARLVLVTDGAVAPPSRRLPAASGLRPLVVALGVGDRAQVRATSLVTLETPQREKPLRLAWRGSAARDAGAEMVVWVDGKEVRRFPVRIGAGEVEIPIATPPLPAGAHVVAARLDVAGDDPIDNGAAIEVTIGAPPSVVVVSDTKKPLVAAALKAQEIDVSIVTSEAFLGRPGVAAAAGVIVLDRVSAAELSSPPVLDFLRRAVERGAGLMYLPREDRGEMYDARKKPFLDLLPLVGQQPPPPPEEKKKPESPPPEEDVGLKPPDPEKRKKEKRLAPTLGLLLLVDSSSSMKDGGRLRLAKEAAIAAAETLHPEDRIGVIQFNLRPHIVLELTKAGDQEEIADRIARIQAEGGTSFGPALAAAKEVFASEDLAIRHVILLSDGQTRPYRLKPLVTSMAALGITVSTVGCGRDFDEQTLSDIAYWGKGRFHPAFDAREVPQIFTVEAERVIEASGARHRRDSLPPTETPKSPDPKQTPKPKPPPEEVPPPPTPPKATPFEKALPAPYLAGIAPQDVPGVFGYHPTLARPGGWVSLRIGPSKEPVCAHMTRGYGRVLAWSVPLEGAWAAHVANWMDYGPLVAQIVRFIHPDGGRERYHVRAASAGRTVTATILDRTSRVIGGDVTLDVRDATGRRPKLLMTRVSDDVFRVALDPRDPASALRVGVAVKGAAPTAGVRAGFARVPPPPEVHDGGLDLDGLSAWADAFGGVVVATCLSIDVPDRVTVHREPFGAVLLPWLLLILVADLVLKRLLPGRIA